MPVTLDQLLKLEQLKCLNVVAGKAGLSHDVVWINTIESPELVCFIHPSELVFLTGVEIKNDHTALITLINGAFKAGAAGCVVNLGPYIPRLPNEVIRFADQNDFPVITVLWEVRLADLTHAICNGIINQSEKDDKTKDLIFSLMTGNLSRDEIHKQIARNDFLQGFLYGVLVVDSDDADSRTALTHSISDQLIYAYFRYYCFEIDGKYAFVVMKQAGKCGDDNDVVKIIKGTKAQLPACNAEIGIGNFYDGSEMLSQSFQEAITAVKILKSQKRGGGFLRFKDLKIGKLLLKLKGDPELIEFYTDVLKPLEDYDKINGTQYLEFLRIYLENDASIVKTSHTLYIHRNTAMYKLDKIERILDQSLASLQTKAELLIALTIHDFFI